jgi:hypothetical protein
MHGPIDNPNNVGTMQIDRALALNLAQVQDGRFSVEETTGFNLDVVQLSFLSSDDMRCTGAQ